MVYICHGKFQTSMRIIRWSKFALNLLSYPFLNCSKLSQIKKDDEELNFIIFQQRIENEKIISQIVRINKVCDQNGERKLFERHKLLYFQYKTNVFSSKI